jgi:quercetin dioxygenase-like cupin family protein
MTDALKRFTSRDFAGTSRVLTARTPERLIHRAVECGGRELAFSDERKHPVWVVDLPSQVLSMTIGVLEPGQTTSKHRHTYETLLYVLEGDGETVIEDVKLEWTVGDALYLPVWAWHQHRNRSASERCRYIACENAPMLQNLGVAAREEA